ncbi:hypothetical protein PIB30_001834 [Stylosanthes scabra]|uniref:RING-type E3 ubiquitin transferase n=1 Tax=Stylosanthes scabra TaxID=79078 RepID=A0ABU6W657_9FABA|nr:hypothetical protein [Stylosanthes scabra]
MATMQYYSLTLVVLIIIIIGHGSEASDNNCAAPATASCGGYYTAPIEFPFWIKNRGNNNSRCGYPGFDINCNTHNQPLLNLPESGDFLVIGIENIAQIVVINDQEECMPRRIMLNRGFSLADSPFQLADGYIYQNYSFYNCSYDPGSPIMIGCLGSSINYSVAAVLSSQPPRGLLNLSSCEFITWGLAPVWSGSPYEEYPTMGSLYDIQLQWKEPNCTDCFNRGGRCGFQPDSTNHRLACYDLPHQGFTRKEKFGISMGVGIPGLIGIIGLICLLQRRKRQEQRRQSSRIGTEFAIMNVTNRPAVLIGLDGPSIERYPKTEVSESGGLPRPNDTICSICLHEYQPKEVLRTITECQHYFHVDCIDGWLKMNATCPLCRKLPA